MVDSYETEIAKFDLYDKVLRKIIKESSEDDLVLLLSRLLHFIGLAGEVGELGEKIKKTIRDNGAKFEPRDNEQAKEMGDIFWYLTRLCSDIGYTTNEVLEINLNKLRDRKKRGVQQGSGDNR